MTLNKLRLNANEKGFTLIELMIVIAIIGILAAIAIPNFISYRNKAYCSSAESDAQSLGAALADYFAIPTNRTFANVGPAAQIPFPGSATITLSGTNTGQITQGVDASGNVVYSIAVNEAANRCPATYRAGNQRWAGFIYSITL